MTARGQSGTLACPSERRRRTDAQRLWTTPPKNCAPSHGRVEISHGLLQTGGELRRCKLWRGYTRSRQRSLKQPDLARRAFIHVNHRYRFLPYLEGLCRGGPVQEYRLFFFDDDGRLSRAPHEFTASDDREAIAISEAWREGRKMELWQRDHRLRCWGFASCANPICS